SGPGRAHHPDGTGGCGDYGARVFARSVLAIASGSRTGATNRVAGAISEGGAERRAATGSGGSEEFRIVLRRATRGSGTTWTKADRAGKIRTSGRLSLGGRLLLLHIPSGAPKRGLRASC